jgi:hypothetical protein
MSKRISELPIYIGTAQPSGDVPISINGTTYRIDPTLLINLAVKADLVNGKVPNSQLPSYVDDVIEGYFFTGQFYTDLAHTDLITPETGKIYVSKDTQYIYRWSGSTYIVITDNTAVWGAITGSIANQTDLVNAYVPYSGANNNLNLGNFNASAKEYKFLDPAFGVYGRMFLDSEEFTLMTDPTTTLAILTFGQLTLQGVSTFNAQITYNSLTANRAYALPNASGTLALTSNIPSVSGTTNKISKFTGANSIGDSQIFDNGTSVGIGTTTPFSKLDLVGNLSIRNINSGGNFPSSTFLRIYGDNQANNFWAGIEVNRQDFADNLDLRFYTTFTTPSEKMRITSAGNVGIGTTTPVAISNYTTLDIRGASGSLLYMGIVGATASLRLIGEGIDGYIDNTNITGSLLFRTNASTERMRITLGGFVGIGTTAPTTKLEVVGNIKSSLSGYEFQIYPAFNTNVVGMGASSNHNLAIVTNAVERVRIDTSGNVGIGTSNPEVKLDVYGSGTVQSRVQSASGGDIRFSVDTVGRFGTYSNADLLIITNGSTKMFVASGGNVGIGTTTPLYKTHIQTANQTFGLVVTTNANDTETGFYIQPDHTNGIVKLHASGGSDKAFGFLTGNTERMRITSVGKVGIGTTNPTYRLTILDSANATSTLIGGGTSTPSWLGLGTIDSGTVPFIQGYNNLISLTTSIALNPSGGNVGIGNTTPLKILTISNTDANTGFSNSRTSVIRVNNASTVIGTFSGIAFGRNNSNTQTTAMIGEVLQDVSSTWASDLVFGVKASVTATDLTEYLRIKIGGNVGIGTTAPTSKLHVVGLVEYATNALAIAGGLTVGAFYHTGGVAKVVI